MILGRFQLRWWWLPAMAVVTAVSSGAAQSPATNAWQTITFSSPSNAGNSSNLISPLPAKSSLPEGVQGRLRLLQDESPVAAFDNPPLPAGPAPIPGRMQRIEKSSSDRQDWEFMTPAEIMGVSPDQILQAQNYSANQGQSSLTTLERYLKQHSPYARLGANSVGNSPPVRNSAGDENTRTNNDWFDLMASSLLNLQPTIDFSQSLSTAPNANTPANQNAESSWSKLLGIPLPPPATEPVRTQTAQMDMSQFLQLFNPDFTPATASTTTPDETASLNTQARLSDASSTEPLGNLIGTSFAPLSSGIGEPIGLSPLPTITRQNDTQPVARPAWAPQPAPWLSPTPQLFAVPQREF